MPQEIELGLGTSSASRNIEHLTALVDRLEDKLHSVASVLGPSATPGQTAEFFGTASQLATARGQLDAAISGSASPGGTVNPFSNNPFGPPQFRMQKLGDVQAAAEEVMRLGLPASGVQAAMGYVMNGAVPMPAGGGMPPQPGGNWGFNLAATAGPSSNRFNPFAGAAPTGPAMAIGTPGVQQMMYQWQQQDAQSAQTMQRNQALALTGIYTGTQMAGAYTQAVVSGAPQPMAFASAIGTGIGAAIGAFAGPIGAIAGGTIGGSVAGAIQAPFVARMQAAQSLGGIAAATGQDPTALANEANYKSGQVNDSWLKSIFNGGGFDNLWRGLGIYTGVDQTSTKDTAAIRGSLEGGYLLRGVRGDDAQLQDVTGRLAKRYGLAAPEVAAAYGRVLAAGPASGDNAVDMLQRVGLTDSLTAMQLEGTSLAGQDALIRGNAAIQSGAYRSGIAASGRDIAVTDYGASGFSGRSTQQRTGSFNTMMASLQNYTGALESEIRGIEAIPGGSDSALAKTKRALLAQAVSEIQQQVSQRNVGIVGDIEAESGARSAGASTGVVRAQLYGGAGDFAGPVGNQLRVLNNEDGLLRGRLAAGGLPFGVEQQVRSRLAAIEQERIALPAQQAGMEFRRRNLSGDLAASSQSVLQQQAGLFGTIGDIEAAGGNAYNTQRQIYNDAILTYNNPAASAEDRAAAGIRANSANSTALSIQVSARDTVLGRIRGGAGAEQAGINFGLTKALSRGTGRDVRDSAGRLSTAMESERNALNDQLLRNDLTVDQRNRVRTDIANIDSRQIELQDTSRDTAFQKDYIAGYGIANTELAGRRAIANYLPYSPSNIMGLGLQQVKLNQTALGLLDKREADLKSAGALSPERQQEITAERTRLQVQDAQVIGELGEGWDTRIIPLSGGRGRFSGRYNSANLASMAVSGNPAIRGYGAVNGSQLREQDDLLGSFAGMASPRSRTQGHNDSTALLERIAATLEKIASGGSRGGSPGRLGAAVGALVGETNRQTTSFGLNGAN